MYTFPHMGGLFLSVNLYTLVHGFNLFIYASFFFCIYRSFPYFNFGSINLFRRPDATHLSCQIEEF